MSIREQDIKDIREMAKLSAETLVETGQQLETTDKEVNKVGKSIVELNAVAKDMNEGIKTQTETMSNVTKRQEDVFKNVVDFGSLIKDILSGVEGNKTKLEALNNTVQTAMHSDTDKQKALINALKANSNEYAKQLKNAFEKLNETDKYIQESDPHDELKTIFEKITQMHNNLTAVEKAMETNHKAAIKQMTDLNESFKASIAKLDKLSEKADILNDDFETSISRLGSIDLKLSTINGTEDKDEDSSDDVEKTDAKAKDGNSADRTKESQQKPTIKKQRSCLLMD